MNIAIVCPYNYFSPGGVQSHIRDSACELRKLGHRITIIAPRCETNPDSISNVVFLGVSKKIDFNQTTFDITFIRRRDIRLLKDLLEKERFDIIHYHTIWTPILSLQILFYSKSINVCTFHDTPPNNISGRITKIILRCISNIIFRFLDVIITVSESPLKHMATIPGKKIHIIPPCIDLSRFSPTQVPLLPGEDDRVTILFLGRLDKRKGLFILLDAFRLLADDGIRARLLIAGTGKERDKLDDYLKSESPSDIVYLDHIHETDLAACYASCDIFCSPALYGESFGIVLIEAMASGKVVLAASNPGYTTVLHKKREFCLSEPGNSNDLYLKLKKLILDKSLRSELAQWGIIESAKYDCKNIVPKLIDIYKGALDFKR